MRPSVKKTTSEANSTIEGDLFYQLLSRYVQQVGVKFESTKAVQEAVRGLEKELQAPARPPAKRPR